LAGGALFHTVDSVEDGVEVGLDSSDASLKVCDPSELLNGSGAKTCDRAFSDPLSPAGKEVALWTGLTSLRLHIVVGQTIEIGEVTW
jgi:hypothetical protein